jgi:hypothetical protein
MYLQRTVSSPEMIEIKAIESQQNLKTLGSRRSNMTSAQATSYWSDCHTHPDLVVSLSLIVLAN